MEIFNLYGDEWNETTEHEGFAFKDSWVGARIGSELIGQSFTPGNWIVVGTPKPAEGVPPPPLNTPLPDDTPAPQAQAAASRPAPPPVADPREMVVRVPERGQPAAPAPAPDPASIPLTVPLPDSPHGISGQPPALGPVEPPVAPLAAPLPLPQAAAPAAAAPAEQFGPIAPSVPGSVT